MIDDIAHDLSVLRGLMARELETINHYRRLAAQATEGALNEFFLHVIEEEKLHVAEVLAAIGRLDADQVRLLGAGFAGGSPAAMHETVLASPAASKADGELERGTQSRTPARAVTRVSSGELTVGSLRGLAQDS